jgi:hypothetical protein
MSPDYLLLCVVLLIQGVAAVFVVYIYITENTTVGTRHADHVAPLYPQKLALTFGPFSSLADSGHRV